MEIAQHIEVIGQEGKLLAEGARRGGLDMEVADCPGWVVRDLVRHLGMIHLWAAGHVTQRHDASWGGDLDEMAAFWPELGVFWPEDEKLVDWYQRTNANLVHTLESAPFDVDSWTFLPAPSPLAMWARRQAHETAIHRYDAENAAGIETVFDPPFAADGIDEILAGFAPRKDEFPVESDRIVAVHATDTNDSWLVTLAPTGITTLREEASGDTDALLSGSASDIYLLLWNRGTGSNVAITGDDEVLELWRDNVRVRWS